MPVLGGALLAGSSQHPVTCGILLHTCESQACIPCGQSLYWARPSINAWWLITIQNSVVAWMLLMLLDGTNVAPTTETSWGPSPPKAALQQRQKGRGPPSAGHRSPCAGFCVRALGQRHPYMMQTTFNHLHAAYTAAEATAGMCQQLTRSAQRSSTRPIRWLCTPDCLARHRLQISTDDTLLKQVHVWYQAPTALLMQVPAQHAAKVGRACAMLEGLVRMASTKVQCA
jgi:hypothetical protein